MRLGRLLGLACVVLAATAAGARAQGSDPEREASCQALSGGLAGVPFFSAQSRMLHDGVRVPDQGNETLGGAGSGPPDAPAGLPERVAFRTATETFNRRYWFVLRDGRIWFRSNADVTGIRQPWRRLPLPACIDGRVTAISADDGNFMVTTGDRRVYSMTTALLAPAQFEWTSRWGSYLWFGGGLWLPADAAGWAISDLNVEEDGTWRDRAGNNHEVAGITTLYALRGDRTRINYYDPWLPPDQSYEVCGPFRGRVRIAALSASGSTLFALGVRGQVYTRLYEFDVSGANSVLYDYSWEDQRGAPDPRVQLPAPDWVRQPPLPGRVTDRISIHKIGRGGTRRILRVEGLDARRRTGYFERDASERAGRGWRFVRTGEPLRGRRLPRARRGLPRRLGPPLRIRYAGSVQGGVPVDVTDFHPACSPATLVVRAGRRPLRLALHLVDGLRQQVRGPGVDDNPREYLAAVQVPKRLLRRRATLDPAARAFLEGPLGGRRFTYTPVQVTRRTMRFVDLCWALRRPDAPTGADLPPAAEDPGETLGRVTAAEEGRRLREPPACG